jgi:hypothetical protein
MTSGSLSHARPSSPSFARGSVEDFYSKAKVDESKHSAEEVEKEIPERTFVY